MPTINVFARTQAELYQDPFKQQQPERSFESLLKELFALKPLTQENADMMARASAIKQELIDTLAGARSAQVEQLEAKHEASILAVREAKRKFSAIAQQAFEARKEHTRLEGVAENDAMRLADLKHEFGELNRALLTKAETNAWTQKILVAKQKAGDSMMAASHQQSAYNALVLQEREATLAHNEAVSVATNISQELERLTK